MKKKITQWHPAFCSAIQLELSDNQDELVYDIELVLNSMPLRIDLLVIKKDRNTVITNEIGQIFRGHNILEFKSPKDAMDIDTFYKSIGYACLYKSGKATQVDGIRADDITITIIRENKPINLINRLMNDGISVVLKTPGIYHVELGLPFAMQFVIYKELDHALHSWLSALTENITQEDAERLILHSNSLSSQADKILADSVLDVAFTENYDIFYKVKEGDSAMCEALRQLMKPEWDAMMAEYETKIAALDAEHESKVATMDAELADKAAELAGMNAELAGMSAELADKDAELAILKAELEKKDALIASLFAQKN